MLAPWTLLSGIYSKEHNNLIENIIFSLIFITFGWFGHQMKLQDMPLACVTTAYNKCDYIFVSIESNLRTHETVVDDRLLSVSFIIINLTLIKILTSNFLQCYETIFPSIWWKQIVHLLHKRKHKIFINNWFWICFLKYGMSHIFVENINISK